MKPHTETSTDSYGNAMHSREFLLLSVFPPLSANIFCIIYISLQNRIYAVLRGYSPITMKLLLYKEKNINLSN
ncbi:MAG: hypothetical protein ACFNUT_05100 [Bacteroidota bacterium]